MEVEILKYIFGPGVDYKATLVWENVKNDSDHPASKNTLEKETLRAKVP